MCKGCTQLTRCLVSRRVQRPDGVKESPWGGGLCESDCSFSYTQKTTPPPNTYTPPLLYSSPRAPGRRTISCRASESLMWRGADGHIHPHEHAGKHTQRQKHTQRDEDRAWEINSGRCHGVERTLVSPQRRVMGEIVLRVNRY